MGTWGIGASAPSLVLFFSSLGRGGGGEENKAAANHSGKAS